MVCSKRGGKMAGMAKVHEKKGIIANDIKETDNEVIRPQIWQNVTL